MSRKIINLPASVRSRLFNISKETKRPFIEVLQYFAIERFLYRLSISSHAEKFFLKGALMFKAWKTFEHRPTMDINLLGRTDNTIASIENTFKDVSQLKPLIDDGLLFFSETVRGSLILSDAEYEGVRIELTSELSDAIIPIQVDIGFGDLIFPSPQTILYPTLLDHPAPKLQGYTPESVIAEKFETMVRRGLLNSRMKDFFDIWLLAQTFSFKGESLSSAILATFRQRKTPIENSPDCFSEVFYQNQNKISQWEGFLRKNRLQSIPLIQVVKEISLFLTPILQSIHREQLFEKAWDPSMRWLP